VDDTPTGVVIEVEYLGDDADRSFTIPSGVEADGSWSASYVVRDDDPVGRYELQATCYNEVGSSPPSLNPFFDYAPATFEVADGPVVPTVLPLSVDPTSGPIGTTVSVSGTDCTGDVVEFALLAETGYDDTTAIVDAWSTEPAQDGAWSGELVVYDTMFLMPDGEEEADVVPGGDYFVAAACLHYPEDVPEAPTPDEITLSEAVDFEITGDGTAPPSDRPPATVITSVVPAAQPATLVAGDPDYTG
jgi:hypothetical protein